MGQVRAPRAQGELAEIVPPGPRGLEALEHLDEEPVGHRDQELGPHARDVASIRPQLVLPHRFEPIDGMRVALCLNLGDYPVDREVEANTLAVGEALRGSGATIEEVELPWRREELSHATLVHFGAIFGRDIGRSAEAHGDLMTPYALAMVGWAREAIERTSYLEGLELEARIYRPLGEVLERFDALVCPTVGARGLVAGDDYVDHGLEVGGVALDRYIDAMLTPAFNVASRCPVLAVPSGFADHGVPTGVQIVGRTYDDATVFRVGSALERARPWPLVAG